MNASKVQPYIERGIQLLTLPDDTRPAFHILWIPAYAGKTLLREKTREARKSAVTAIPAKAGIDLWAIALAFCGKENYE